MSCDFEVHLVLKEIHFFQRKKFEKWLFDPKIKEREGEKVLVQRNLLKGASTRTKDVQGTYRSTNIGGFKYVEE